MIVTGLEVRRLADPQRRGSQPEDPSAISLFERTLADIEPVLAENHPNTLASRNNLARVYRAAGRLDEATASRRPRTSGHGFHGLVQCRNGQALRPRRGRGSAAISLTG